MIQLKTRKWRWIGHTFRKTEGAVEKQALDWNPQGARRRGRLRITWKRSIYYRNYRGKQNVERGQSNSNPEGKMEELHTCPMFRKEWQELSQVAIFRLRKPLKTSTRLVGHGIWTRDLPNASLLRYHGATSLGSTSFVNRKNEQTKKHRFVVTVCR